MVTVTGVGRFNGRHLDQRRSLLPRDYATDPSLFGVDPNVGFRVPAGGDAVSMLVAQAQHLLMCEWNQQRCPTAEALAELVESSKQVISRVSRGERWIGETIFAALMLSLAGRAPATDSSR